MSEIRVESVKSIPLYSVVPLINHISYDSWLLRVSLFFSTEEIRCKYPILNTTSS